ncbi:hypothetical protein [Hymenobacter sp.]|uniref:hypothetical protein n=1 Tax=Hymenobacter sp. TaxID=1898978 RepID=UPI00286B5992|nr:hypothetical protein [Hymenobacter sp.]
MRRAARTLLLGLAAGLVPGLAPAQTAPALPAAPAVSPRPDSVKSPPPTFVADTARRVSVVTAEPTDAVTRRSAWRIGAAIAVLTLTTLLLYNVRSR